MSSAASLPEIVQRPRVGDTVLLRCAKKRTQAQGTVMAIDVGREIYMVKLDGYNSLTPCFGPELTMLPELTQPEPVERSHSEP